MLRCNQTFNVILTVFLRLETKRQVFLYLNYDTEEKIREVAPCWLLEECRVWLAAQYYI